jgi:hypothetical protein
MSALTPRGGSAPSGKEREIACAGRVDSELPKLRGVLRCDPDNALSLGDCR